MNYYSYNEIANQFSAFIEEIGIHPADTLYFVADGELHRFRTTEDDTGQTSGAYTLHNDKFPAGFVQDWRKQVKANWKFTTGGDPQEKKSFNAKSFNEEARKRQQEREAQLKAQYDKAAELARIYFEGLPDSSIHSHDKNFHPYVKAKGILPFNARLDKENNALVIPLYNIEGNIRSLQWIYADGKKRFYPNASTKGVFCNIYDEPIKEGSVILIGEGFATMSRIYDLTHNVCIAAMSSGNLIAVVTAFREKYPRNKILIAADNDIATYTKAGYNPGLDAATEIAHKKIANAVIPLELKEGVDEDCSDWDDYARKYGDGKARERLKYWIWWLSLSQEERNEIDAENKLNDITINLDPEFQIPPQEFVGGIFPKKFVTIIAAAPGTGKTILMQRTVSDLSLGGTILGGVAENEPARRSLIFAGEAGRDMLIRRASSFKWPIKPPNVKIVDQHLSELKELPVMLDDPEGMKNVERLIRKNKPDIVYWDTFSSFHDKDENKATEIKPLIRAIATLADKYNFAAVLNHHSRKRLTKERNLALNQDDVIGSSIFNRLAALIIGIEKDEDNIEGDGKILKVRPLKTWFRTFKSFNFSLEEGFWGGTVMNIDTNPKDANNSRNGVWDYLVDTFKPGEWFSREDIAIDLITPKITERQLRRALNDFVQKEKLQKQGSTKDTRYSIS